MKMPKWLQNKRKIVKVGVITCVAILLSCLLGTTLFGYPQWFARSLAKGITPKDGSCEIGHIRGSLLAGFTVEELVCEYPTKAGRMVIHIPEAKAKISLKHLIFGKLLPSRLTIDNADVHLDLFHEDDSLMDAVILQAVNLHASISQNGQLNATLSGELLDVLLKCEIRLDNADKWKFSTLKKTGGDEEAKEGEGIKHQGEESAVATTGDDTKPRKYDQKLMNNIHSTVAEVRNATKSASSVYIISALTGSLADNASLKLNGSIGLSDAVIYGRSVLKTYAKFRASLHDVLISELHVVFNAQESISGETTICLDDKTIEGKYRAVLMPETLLRLLDAPTNILPRFFDFKTPIRFDGELTKAKWNLASVKTILDFDCKDLFIQELAIKRVSGQFVYFENTVDLNSLLIEVDDTQQDSMKGNLHFQLPDKVLSGSLQGRANLGEVLRRLKILQTNTPIDSLKHANITVNLEPSPIQDWHLWNASLAVQQTNSVIANFPLQDFLAELHLQDKHLAFNAKGILNGEQQGTFAMDTKAELPESITGAPIDMVLHANINTAEKDALDATATFIWENKDFRIEDGHGIVRPDLLNPLMEAPLKLGNDSPLSFFHCLNPDKPAVVDFHVPPIHATGRWVLLGNAVMEEMQLLNTDFALLTTNINLTEKDIGLQGIQGKVLNSEGRISCGLKIQFSPMSLRFNDVDVIGNPILISQLLYDEDAIQVYKDIWKDFQWTEASETHIHANILDYEDISPTEWYFRLKGSVELNNFAYNDMPMRSMSNDLDIILPKGQLTFENIKIADTETTEGDVLVGNASLQLEDSIGGTFHLEKRGGRLRTLEILMRVFSTLEEDLRPFDLAPEANFTCDGRFEQDNFLLLGLQGTIESPQLKYENFVIHNFKGTWNASNAHLAWDLPEAEFYNGTLTTTGYYSFQYNRGDLMARAENLPLAKLLQMLQAKSKSKEELDKYAMLPGTLSASGHFTFLRNWANCPLHLEGKGEAHVSGADLWRVPTFTTLGKLIANGSFQFFSKDKIASLGKITKVDGHFDCQGTSIRFDDLRTDGSIIALKGSGEYKIDTQEVDFLLSGELMKSVSFISLVLRPIAWAFDARLTGNASNPVWTIQTPLSKIF